MQGLAFVFEHAIRQQVTLCTQVMGVCPQHDLLWETLTAREHLNFYGRLKRLRGAALKVAVDDVLASMKLSDVGNKRCSKYSGGVYPFASCLHRRSPARAQLRYIYHLYQECKNGGEALAGMKRRLSVAISLIGSPKVAYLDEPSTGLDPASRRNLWDVVKREKAGKAVILTTHSMEEAEVLCDRLGIFVGGRLVCIGNPKQLTSRYGGYYVRPVGC